MSGEGERPVEDAAIENVATEAGLIVRKRNLEGRLGTGKQSVETRRRYQDELKIIDLKLKDLETG